MAQYQITVDDDLTQGLFTRSDNMAQLVEQVLNQVLRAQVTDQLQADRYEQTADRQGYRNGTRERTLKSRIGMLNLSLPRVRSGSFSTEMFERYQRSEQALLLALIEMVVQGVSTRKVNAIVEELCDTEFSKSTVSALCKRLDPLVKAWNERDLSATAYPFVVVDALVIRVRKDGRVRMQSALIATGVNVNGYREVLGIQIGDSESEATWSEFHAWLKARGLAGVDLVVSDDHQGLVKAVHAHFQGATWQRCQTHLMHNILEVCPKAVQPELHRALRLLFEAPDTETARSLLAAIIEQFGAKAARSVQCLEAGFDDATAILSLPEPYRKRLRTTNGQERLNEEIRRRERVIRIFPNVESALRLLGAVLMEIDESWSTGKRYLDMDEYLTWRREPPGHHWIQTHDDMAAMAA
jgi:transposase-like protein